MEDRGKESSFETAHFCSHYVQPMGLACIQTVHMCVHAQSKGLCALGENTLCPKTLTYLWEVMKWLHCKTGLRNVVELCSLCTEGLQRGCSPDGILIFKALGLYHLFSSGCNLLCVSFLLVVLFLSNLFKPPILNMSLQPTNSPPIILQGLQTFLEIGEAFGKTTVGGVV